MGKIFELIILGAGPAGITAAIYASRKRLDFLLITRDIGGQAAWSGDIENYTGYQFISGPELTLKFQEHMDKFGIVMQMPEAVSAIERIDQGFKVVTDKSEYLSRSVIVATGKQPRMLNVPGEKEYKNKGLTYCATCDGPLFADKAVAVIGGGNSGLDAALQMMKIAKKVYLIESRDKLVADKIMLDKALVSPLVEVWTNTRVKAIKGDKFVKELVVEKSGVVQSLAVEGVFVEIGLVPNTEFIHPLKMNENKEIIVDCQAQTDIPGLFAAGDVTNVRDKQIVVACGEGAKACLSCFEYLSRSRF